MVSATTSWLGRMRHNGEFNSSWQTSLVLLGAILLALGFIHRETAVSIAAIWSSSETYNHGWLMIPAALWLAWYRRSALVDIRPQICWAGLLVVAGVEMLWVAAEIAGVAFAQHLALIGLIPATVLTLLGHRAARVLAFPLGYLIFAVPWGEGFVPFLQDVTAWMSVQLLELSGVPVFWEGRMISIPVADFEVAEACSGVRYVIASLAVGALYAYMVYRSAWRRLAFLGAALLVPVLANGLRAYGIIMLASISDMKLAVGVDHLIYGWLFFGLVMLLLFWLGSFGREPDSETGADELGTTPSAPGHEGVAVRAGGAAAVLAIGLLASMLPQWSANAQPVLQTSIIVPPAASGWERMPAERPGWLQGFDGADEIVQATYGDGDAAAPLVQLLVVHYRRERQGAELINTHNRLYGESWAWLGGGKRVVKVGDRRLEVREIRIRQSDRNQLIWSWYEVGGWQTTREPVAKGLAALLRLTAQRGDATLAALAAPYDRQPREAVRTLQAFLQDHPRVAAERGLVSEP